MANTFKFGNKKWAVKKDYVLAYNDENNNFKPLPFDFTRDSTATYVDSDGLIKTAGEGIARIDYADNTDGHLLLEPQRRNIMTDSELSPTLSITSGDGSVSDVTLSNGLSGKEITVTSSGRVYFIFTVTAVIGTVYTISAFVEDYTGPFASNFIDIFSGGSGENLSTNLIENGRMQGTFTATSTSVTIRIGHGTTANKNGAYSAKISGIQVEDAGSGVDATYATSYIPTSGTSVTRAVDKAEQTISVDDIIVDDDSTIYFEIETTGLVDNTPNTGGFSFKNSSGTPKLNFNYGYSKLYSNYATGSTTAIKTPAEPNTVYKVAFPLTSGSNLYINGTQGTSTTRDWSAISIKEIEILYGHSVKDFRIYNSILSNSELETLTTL